MVGLDGGIDIDSGMLRLRLGDVGSSTFGVLGEGGGDTGRSS